MTPEEILNNVIKFVNEAIIVGGYGFEYKQAMRYILIGKPYEEVIKWYNNILEGKGSQFLL